MSPMYVLFTYLISLLQTFSYKIFSKLLLLVKQDEDKSSGSV